MSSTNTFYNTRNKLSNELGALSTTSCGWGWKRYNGLPPPPPPLLTYLLLVMMNIINHNLCRAEAGIAYNMTTKHDHDHEDVLL